ncbi:unnamed protein product [Larinioides sclopetarius]|uniref:Uncharacterized protein n=1 Tax=Larinioides sclopetarius TaxID=280406 RepID=A0AAV2A539_9ARAC
MGRPTVANEKRVIGVRAHGSHGTSGRSEQQRVRLGPRALYTFPVVCRERPACISKKGSAGILHVALQLTRNDTSYMSLRDLDTGPSNCEDVASEAAAPASSRHSGPTQQSSRARLIPLLSIVQSSPFFPQTVIICRGKCNFRNDREKPSREKAAESLVPEKA